jgi:MFS transporter, MHS family, proline/betaine transporter
MCLGNLVEFYDFATFGASAAVLASVLTANQGGLTSVFVVLAAALLIRPIGAVLVGRFSDRHGRRIPFLAMTAATCAATAAVGLLPSVAAAGLAAVLGLAVLRCLQAFCTGGETSTSVTYLFESATPGRRGLFGGFHLASAASGMALGLTGVLLVQAAVSPAQLIAWGWRLPFLAAVPLALVVFGLRRRLHESGEFTRAHAVPTPRTGGSSDQGQARAALGVSAIAKLVRRQPRTVLTGLLLGGAFSATVNLWFVYAPAYLLATGRATAATALGPAVAGLLACAALAPLSGALSDRLGRPAVLITACIVLSLLWPTTIGRVMTGDSWVTFAVASLTLGAALSGFVLASQLPEAFSLADRATGVGLTFGVGSGAFGGLAPLLAGWLVARHDVTSVAVYPAVCAVLAAVALAWSTRRPDVAGVALGRPQPAGAASATAGE